MPLYASLHTDYVTGRIVAADDPAGTHIIEAPNAESAQRISIEFDMAEPTAASDNPDDYVDETAIVNLDKIFESPEERKVTHNAENKPQGPDSQLTGFRSERSRARRSQTN